MSYLEIILTILAVTYCVLIYRLWKLEHSFKKMNDRADRFETFIKNMSEKMTDVAHILKTFNGLKDGQLHVAGNTPLGKIDVDVQLKKNGETQK